MSDIEIHAVTGAFGYSGQYIARRLLAGDGGAEIQLRTLTSSPERTHDFGEAVEVHGFHFDEPMRLVESLRGVKVLYNTYWFRFNHRNFKQADAVTNTKIMFEAAAEAGVERIVHVSITNPALDSPLEYFHSKAVMEEALRACGVSYAILRPAVLFGKEDILINNIAWMLRRFPIFGVFGDGSYRLQPIHVDDLAALAVEMGKTRESTVINAIGPETFSYRELVEQIGEIIGKRRLILPLPIWFGYWLGVLVGKWVGDVVITKQEIEGLMGDLLYVEGAPVPACATTKLTEWARRRASTLGRKYTSEVARRVDRRAAYESN